MPAPFPQTPSPLAGKTQLYQLQVWLKFVSHPRGPPQGLDDHAFRFTERKSRNGEKSNHRLSPFAAFHNSRTDIELLTATRTGYPNP